MKTFDSICMQLEKINQDLVINPVETSFHEIGELALAVYPRPESSETIADVVIADQLNVSPILKWLAWGIYDSDKLVAWGRTSREGHFCLNLPAGDYTIRFVPDCEDELDREILQRINDLDARSLIEEFDTVNGGAWWDEPLVGERELVGGGVGFADEVDPYALPEGKNAGLCNNGTAFKLDFPVRSAEHPNAPEFVFGCALVELLNASGKVVARALMPVREHNGRNFGDLQIDDLWDEELFRGMELGWNSLDSGLIGNLKTSTSGREWLTDQLKTLLSRPMVKYDEALKDKVNAALKFIDE